MSIITGESQAAGRPVEIAQVIRDGDSTAQVELTVAGKLRDRGHRVTLSGPLDPRVLADAEAELDVDEGIRRGGVAFPDLGQLLRTASDEERGDSLNDRSCGVSSHENAIAKWAHADWLAEIGLIGARWVMEEDLYLGRLRAAGLDG